MNKNLYSKITNALVDDGYIVIKNALEQSLCLSLLNCAKNENNFKQAGISNSNNLHIDNMIRRDKIAWLEEDQLAQSEFLSFAEGLKDHLNKELYLGLSYYESHFAVYDEGDFYGIHLDSFKNSKNRVVTTVYYLNSEWEECDGGELIVYNEEGNFLTKIIPQANTLVVFLSHKFPHEVLPAKKTRYSIAGWLRVEQI